MSNRFELETDSINLSANESDVVQWKLVQSQVARDMSLVETPSLEPSSLEEEWSIMDNSARRGSCEIDLDDGEPPPATPPPTASRGLSIESMYTMWNKSDHESNKRRQRDDEEEEEEGKCKCK
jgi:hypothetical protein